MLKHFYSSPTIRKKRSKSQSSDTESIDDIHHHHHHHSHFHHIHHHQQQRHQSDDDFNAITNRKLSSSSLCMSARCRRCPTNINSICDGSSSSTTVSANVSPVTAAGSAIAAAVAENSVRRWNSFHSTRGECHPNKFRRDRKSTSPSIDLGQQQQRNIIGSPIRKYSYGSSSSGYGGSSGTGFVELRRGNSLAEKSTTPTSLLASPSSSICSASDTESTFCFGKRNGSNSSRRSNDCFVAETSEMIIIDYADSDGNQSKATNVTSTTQQQQQQLQQLKISVATPPPLSTSSIFHHRTLNSQNTSSIGSNNGSILTGSGIGGSTSGGGGGGVAIGGGYGGGSQNTKFNSSLSLSSIGGHPQQQQQQKQQSYYPNPHSHSNHHHHHHQQQQHYSIATTPTSGGQRIGSGGSVIIPYRRSIGGGICCGHIPNMDHHVIRHASGVNIVFEDSSFGSNRPELYQKCNRGSHSSDTSSAYSGSDTMTSVHSSSLDADEVDLSGLVESVVDSDEEDLAESMDSLAVRDTVRECLEKDPSDRTDDDIETLLDFTKNLKAFTNMTLAVRRALCSVMVFAVVEKAGTMVMNNGEELDSWSVLINGHVEIEHQNYEKEELQVGDSFGILPTMDKLYHRGIMRTKCNDCQFVCITQTDYYRIQHQGEENTKRHEDETGQLVMVTELRHHTLLDGSTRRGHVVIRGTIDRLMLQLIEENSIIDSTYVEDFLLTYRTFIDAPKTITKQLLLWFNYSSSCSSSSSGGTLTKSLITNDSSVIDSEHDVNDDATDADATTDDDEKRIILPQTVTASEIRDRVTRVVLLWVNNHFTDFEIDPKMMEFLETFEIGLESHQMYGHLRLLHIACAAKARQRTVTLARSSRDENLHFTIVGGYDQYQQHNQHQQQQYYQQKYPLQQHQQYKQQNYGIFIIKVDEKSKAEDVGLKRGDQILEVNGQSFEHVTLKRAIELLMSTTHLSITVKSNLLTFKEMLQYQQQCEQILANTSCSGTSTTSSSPTKSQRLSHSRRKIVSDINKLSLTNDVGARSRLSSVELSLSSHDYPDCSSSSSGGGVLSSTNYCKKDLLSTSTNLSSSSLLGAAAQTSSSITPATTSIPSSSSSSTHKSGFMTLGPKRRLQKALIKMNLLPKNIVTTTTASTTPSSSSTTSTPLSSSSMFMNNLHDDSNCTIGCGNNTTATTSTKNASSDNLTETGTSSSSSSTTNNDNNNRISNNHNINNLINNNTINNNNIYSLSTSSTTTTTSTSSSSSSSILYQSHSNPDLTTIYYDDLSLRGGGGGGNNLSTIGTTTSTGLQSTTIASDYPEHVLKVYKSDQTCKYLLIHKETTAHEVVMLALQEFGIHETSSNFSLCEVSVAFPVGGSSSSSGNTSGNTNASTLTTSSNDDNNLSNVNSGMIKQRRLPDQLQNLAERIGLAARYYLKTNGITETLVPDDMIQELIRESIVHFLQLNANELSIQLTFQDFAIFRQIESIEYVNDLFDLHQKNSTTAASSSYGTPMLKQFAELVNREMFWVVTEVCSEHNIVRRMKIIKQFIKIARHCKECKNFNSMFAIISGLGHAAVSRLRQTWEKLPTKYQKLFYDLQDLMDPSRNMSKYRQLIVAELLEQHPIIPFYPLVKKDLTFIHLGNDTIVENLINFEKLRMIAKEIRGLTLMCSTAYDLLTMLELKGQSPSSAMVALNQMSVGLTTQQTSGLQQQQQQNQQQLQQNQQQQQHATVKRRKKSTTAPNPKKMFEEAQMVRRVKSYLNNLKIITDEDSLHRLSLECEPSGGSAPNTVIIRKRHPSPTLSTTSSTSSTSENNKKKLIIGNNSGGGGGSGGNSNNSGPKFGAASPQAVKKILSLSEQNKTRPHQPRHPPPPPTLPIVGGIPLQNIGGVVNSIHQHHNLHHSLHSSISPSPSPGAHRRMGSSSSAGSVSYTTNNFQIGNNINTIDGVGSGSSGNNVCVSGTIIGCGGRAVHERSHSDTPTPLPSVDLSAESSSVTSLSNMPLRKNKVSGSVTSSDSGHGSCVQTDNPSNCSENTISGLYHVASSIVHNSPSPTLQQRRHSALHGTSNYNVYGLMPAINSSSSSLSMIHHNMLPSSSDLQDGSQLSTLLSQHQQQQQQHHQHQHQQSSIAMTSSISCSSINSSSSSGGGSCISNNVCHVGGSGVGSVGVCNSNIVSGVGSGGNSCNTSGRPPFPHAVAVLPPLPPYPAYVVQSSLYHLTSRASPSTSSSSNGHNLMAPPPPKGPRHPPAYSVAAQMARLHRLGRAHSHEGVTSGAAAEKFYLNETSGVAGEEDDDEDAQVSAV